MRTEYLLCTEVPIRRRGAAPPLTLISLCLSLGVVCSSRQARPAEPSSRGKTGVALRNYPVLCVASVVYLYPVYLPGTRQVPKAQSPWSPDRWANGGLSGVGPPQNPPVLRPEMSWTSGHYSPCCGLGARSLLQHTSARPTTSSVPSMWHVQIIIS